MEYKSIVVLTGAGISAESGIRTFRGAGGLWEGHSIEEVATPEGFARNPKLVHEFYNQRRKQLSQAGPNPGHLALAQFEQSFKGEFLLVTQNVDDLHERAGSKKLLHIHGELLRGRCQKSGKGFTVTHEMNVEQSCQCCLETSNLRPDIVWFGEMPFHLPVIEKALKACDLFVSIGTSGQVYPAAMFVQWARRSGKGPKTVELNLEKTDGSWQFDEARQGPASELVPSFFSSLK